MLVEGSVVAALAAFLVVPIMVFGRKKQLEFRGKHVLITGGSTGIGLAMAELLAAGGAHLTLVARSESKLAAARQHLLAKQPEAKVQTISADVTQAESVQKVIAQAESSQGPVYGLICNAGSATPGKFLQQEASVFSRTMDLNYMGVVNVLKAALPGMTARGQGHVVVVSSVMAIIGFTGYASYAPSKWAVRGLCDCLRNELAGSGVGISIAYPPDTDTPGYETEKTLMPKDGREISTMGGESLFPASQVARCIISGAERGDYHIRGPDVGLNILVSSMAGFSPRMYNFVVDLILAPLLTLVARLATVSADRTVRRHAQNSTTTQ
mmetsp:Transcript_3625/g.10504  ORF Transcript_3625/g.10504 Transcript_3625/m.10504 type:complete len:325 (-) Transcript_3625:661-1635(-)